MGSILSQPGGDGDEGSATMYWFKAWQACIDPAEKATSAARDKAVSSFDNRQRNLLEVFIVVHAMTG